MAALLRLSHFAPLISVLPVSKIRLRMGSRKVLEGSPGLLGKRVRERGPARPSAWTLDPGGVWLLHETQEEMSGGLGERAGGEGSSGNICSTLRGIQGANRDLDGALLSILCYWPWHSHSWPPSWSHLPEAWRWSLWPLATPVGRNWSLPGTGKGRPQGPFPCASGSAQLRCASYLLRELGYFKRGVLSMDKESKHKIQPREKLSWR